MRILFVVLPRSPHSARHVNLLVAAGWEVHVAATYPAALLPEFSPRIVVHTAPTDTPAGRWRTRLTRRVRLATARTAYRAGDLVRGVTGRPLDPGPFAIRPAETPRRPIVDGIDFGELANESALGASRRAPWLAELIDALRPDVIHSFSIQQASYLTLAAGALCRRPFPPWIVGNWGQDIHFYRQIDYHRSAISAVLTRCDFYMAECQRDVDLARGLGFAGTALGVAPIGGGFDVARLRRLRSAGPTSSRRLIMVKGYQDLVGRGLVALRALALCADVLGGYRVAVYLANPDVKLAAELLGHDSGIPVDVLPYLPYDELMRHHGRARFAIGLSLSDGISTSALEAMIMGALPIQSHTSCLDEWIRDGETGLLVHPNDPIEVAAAIRRAVADDELVDAAAVANHRTVAARLDTSLVTPSVLAMYERVAEEMAWR